MVFKDIQSFVLSGDGINQSVIICSSPASIIVRNSGSFTIKNITLIHCTNLSSNQLYVSVLLYYCSLVTMQNVYINVSSNASAALTEIYEMNVAKSTVVSVKVQVNILKCHCHPIKINGLVIYYNVSTKVQFTGVRIETFHYSQKSCLKYSQSAIKCMILSGPFGVLIENTVFANLRNSSALHYYSSENNAHNDTTQRLTYLQIINVIVMRNMVFGYLKMFHIMLREFEPLQSRASNFIKNVESIAGFTDVRA